MTIKNKNLSFQSTKLLDRLIQTKQSCFNINKAYKLLPNSNTDAVKKLLSDMAKRGLLMRIKEGHYYIIPFEQDAKTFMPDWHLIAECLVKNAKHYVGYYSALQIYDLITQPSMKEQIVVSKQLRPSKLKIKNIQFQFIYHNEHHFFGSKKVWIDSFHKVNCSDLEKTFIDCLFKPDYAGGIVEIARAIYISKDKIKFDRLLKYVNQFQSQAVIKRLGFLLELFQIKTNITESLQQMKTDSYVLLDTELPRSGKMLNRWSIQQNVETETIMSSIYT
jgi:predicted transcriptional regulator of viral defense system